MDLHMLVSIGAFLFCLLFVIHHSFSIQMEVFMRHSCFKFHLPRMKSSFLNSIHAVVFILVCGSNCKHFVQTI